MRLAIASDLHLEFNKLSLKNKDNADVLILAGDTFLAQDMHDHKNATYTSINAAFRAFNYREFLKEISNEFPQTLMVAGNHEFYGSGFHKALEYIREELPDNVKLLEDEQFQVNNVHFFGATLWSNLSNPIQAYQAQQQMSDYVQIRDDEQQYCKLTAINTTHRHLKSVKAIRNWLADPKVEQVGQAVNPCTTPDPNKACNALGSKRVIITHHAPSWESVPSYYKKDILSYAYASSLENLMLDYEPDLWIHGHLHDAVDYKIGNTRVKSNPRGYENYPFKTVTLELS